jgi:hypothetical protein
MKYASEKLRPLPATLLVLFFVSIAAAQCIQPPAGLISWWPGDGNARDIADSNQGVLQGGAKFAAGKVAQAFFLDGKDDFVTAGNAPNLHVSKNDFTVDAWVLFNALSQPPGQVDDMSIVDKMSASGVNTDGWRLLKQHDNRFWFCLGGGSLGNQCFDPNYTVFSTTKAVTGAWFHVAAVKSSDSFAIYINGVLEDIRSVVPSFHDTNSAGLRIGSYVLEGSHLNGLVDEVEIFNRALSGSEIASIFNAGSAGKCRPQCAPNVTDQLQIRRGPILFDSTTQLFVQRVKLTNVSNSPITGPIYLVLDNLGSHKTRLANQNGVTTCAAPIDSPYRQANLGQDNLLSPGEYGVVILKFWHPLPGTISYTPRVLAGDEPK